MEDDDDFDFLLQLAAADDARDPKGPPALLVRDDDTILKEAYGGSIDRNEHSRQASQTAASSTSGAIQGNPSRTGVKSHNITQADLLQRPKADSVCTQHVACYKEEISGLRVSLINLHSSLTNNTEPRPSVIDSTAHGRCLGPSWDRSWSGIASTTPAPS